MKTGKPVDADTMPKADSKLSHLQKHLLYYLARRHAAQEARNDIRGLAWGAYWKVGGTPAERAAYSRALRRLEQRGLVLRQNETSGAPHTGSVRTHADQPHKRTTNV